MRFCHCGDLTASITAMYEEKEFWDAAWEDGDVYWWDQAESLCQSCWDQRCDVSFNCN